MVLLHHHPPQWMVRDDGDVPQSVFVFHSKSVASGQRKALCVNLPLEELEVFDNLLVGPHHHLHCRLERN